MANNTISVEELQSSIEALESRNAFQDDVIEQLNQELTVHQEQIAEMQQQMRLLATRIKDGTSGNQLEQEEVEPPPPHY